MERATSLTIMADLHWLKADKIYFSFVRLILPCGFLSMLHRGMKTKCCDQQKKLAKRSCFILQ
jgi:hypothetical protein